MDHNGKIFAYHDELKDIIDGSRLDPEQKEAFKSLFEKIYRYTEKRYEKKLSEAAEAWKQRVFPSESPTIPVYTALIEKKSLENGGAAGLSEITDPSEMVSFLGATEPERKRCFLGVFLKCSRQRFNDLTTRDSRCLTQRVRLLYPGEKEPLETVCELWANDAYAAAETPLRQLARQYAIDTPMVFSPWARHFAEVRLLNLPARYLEQKPVDIDFPELRDDVAATTLTHTLAWNVTVSEREVHYQPYGSPQPGVPEMWQTFRFPKCPRNTYVLADGLYGVDRITAWRNAESSELFLSADRRVDVSEHRLLRIEEVHEGSLRKLSTDNLLFKNEYRKNLFRRERLRTASDVACAIWPFQGNGYDIMLELDEQRPIRNGKTGGRMIAPYAAAYQYGETPPLSADVRGVCELAFSGAQWFLEDFALYVLDYLQRTYPEIPWRGVRKAEA